MKLISYAVSAALGLSCTPADAKWITSWSIAPTPRGAMEPVRATPSFDNQTIRQVLRLSAGGKAVRIRLTNVFGVGSLRIGGARIVLLDASGREQPGTSRVLRFAGSPSAVISQGAPFVSDSVMLDVPPLSRLALSLYLPEETGLCTCNLSAFDDVDSSPPAISLTVPSPRWLRTRPAHLLLPWKSMHRTTPKPSLCSAIL